MARKLTRWLILFLGMLLLAVVVGGGVLYWRLQQGPISLPTLQPRVRAALAESLRPTGMRADFRDVVVEIDKRRRLPTLRLRDLVLRGRDGGELLRAPRAAFALAMSDLLRGRPRLRHLELVGPALTLRRDSDGHFRLGERGRAPESAAPDNERDGQKHGASYPVAGGALLHDLQRVLRGQGAATGRGGQGSGAGPSLLGALQSISISRADIRYHDALLGLNWRLPDAELTLRRVPYGFALMAGGNLHGIGETPLPVEMNVAWRQSTGRIGISLQAQGLHLGRILSALLGLELRDRLAALASARISAEMDSDGMLKSVAGEMLLGEGRVSFPGWLAHEVRFREGLLRLDYNPASGSLRISRGELRHAAGRVRLAGSIGLEGGLQDLRALRLDLDLRNDAESGRAEQQALLRRIMLAGRYEVPGRQLHVDDLQFFGGGAALRLRGLIRAEPEGMGLYVSGRGRNISHDMLKRLWPPKLGAGAREWLHENVSGGRIPQASMRLALPAKVIRAAVERDVPMPDDVADIRFQVSNVRFVPLQGWPLVKAARGEGILRGNTFRLVLEQGTSRLPSGKVVKLPRGEVRARELAARVSPGSIEVGGEGNAAALQELIDMPPLRLRQRLGIVKGTVRGQVSLATRLRLAFRRGMTGDDVRVERVRVKITRADVLGMVKNFDLRQGNFDVVYEKGLLKTEGVAKVNDLPIRLLWQRPLDNRAKGHKPLLRLRARLTQAQQRKLGIDLSPWLSGPLQLQAEAPGDSLELRRFRLRVGLDAVAMQLPAIGWRRKPQKGTRAVFDLLLPGRRGGPRIENLRLSGPGGLRVEGRMRLDGNGRFAEATFSRFELNANNRLALGLQFDGGKLNVAAAGPVFDARALIARLFAPRREIDRSLSSVFVRVNLKRVLALRGEYIENVRGEVEMRNGLVRRANLTGNFPNGRKVVLDLMPAANGLRRLRIVSDDAGALLRASDLYSRIVGGRAEFTALLKSGDDGGVQRGLLILRKFRVQGDQRLARLQQRGGRGKAGPRRRKEQRFKKLVLPFSTDSRFIRIGDAIIRSPEIGATANGMIRRADGAMDIGGVIIPAYALNAAFGKIPILGALLTGGKGQGVFGMTYALKGSMDRPKFIVNPLSAVAPGVFRQLFHIGGQNVNPDGTARRRGNATPRRLRNRSNLANGG